MLVLPQLAKLAKLKLRGLETCSVFFHLLVLLCICALQTFGNGKPTPTK